ncbi:MAG: hypothetical protein MUC57_20100, partial [Desulfobacterales bacterium]|nr:hypothetical protein [Desulfobacterales bacterium]
LSLLSVGSRRIELKDVHFMRGLDIHATGKLFRRMVPGAGHRSILRIGPAGEALSAMAGVIVDTYRHFGRLGAGSWATALFRCRRARTTLRFSRTPTVC